jgi:hypothetical protein
MLGRKRSSVLAGFILVNFLTEDSPNPVGQGGLVRTATAGGIPTRLSAMQE